MEKLLQEKESVSCSINLSGKTLTESTLKEYILSLLENNKINPERITFEVTETYAVQHIEIAQDFIEWAINLGFQFALDDFGQGVSSFSYLQLLPINKLKIDGSFIKNIETNEKNRMFVETMTKLSHQMDMTCVAEFVENDEIIKILKDLNVDFLQGYGIHKPEEWKDNK
jgi:EAL domain-containing protein (putative c-di-GMP-specific phosphodiesterase class I)